ncbi:MAG: acyltransferase family protein [Bacilli bacterium]|nr:acyltransferase family protein [Bacilli bacterium]
MKYKKEEKKYYRDLDIVRVFACIAIFLYHLGILKGGYLAVCTFFALSGYLSCISAFRKEKFSLKDYYKNRFLHIYLPLLLVVFISIAVVSLIPSIGWINLKPETTSVLLGYNNFWQLNANLDYFTRHVDSPFMHLWYIAILLQFDLVFPFIYIGLKKLGDKYNKIIPCIITMALAIIGATCFYIMSTNQNVMIVYYNTFLRIYSLLFGLSLGFIHSYYSVVVPEELKKKPFNIIMYCSYMVFLICLFIMIDSASIFFASAMIITTLVTLRIIDYSTITPKKNLSKADKVVKSLSSVSYEVYLFQYPVIFLLQNLNIPEFIKVLLIIIIVFIVSYILHFSLNFDKKGKYKIIKYIIRIIILGISLYGIFQYIIAEDHTAEMKALEEQLNENQKMVETKQEEYLSHLKEEEDAWNALMDDLDNAEEKLHELVTNLPVVGVGDSVMLGASPNLYETFPNAYIDAKVSRTDYEAGGILKNLASRGMLGEPIVINLGANGGCPEACRIEIMNVIGDRKAFWLNVTNDKDVHMNSRIESLASKYSNLHVIDWNSISTGHPEYFVSDGIHLTTTGRKAFATAIYNSIYEVYLAEHNAKKEQLLQEHEDELKTKVTFYGNDLLLNAFDSVHDNFETAKFAINKEYTFDLLKAEIEKSALDNSLTYKIVFAFDKTLDLSIDEYNELIELCKEHEIYILLINKEYTFDYDNVITIDFYKEISSHPEYLMVDKIHLTEDGNNALSNMLKETIK